jgi:ADP-heptose:LPS heptosyltransferase
MISSLLSFFMPSHSFRVKDLHRIALICYGGLGDVLLFSPVIREIRQWLPHVHLTLYTEERSASVGSVLEGVDVVLSMPVGSLSKFQFFKYLVGDLRLRHYDAVISTGRNPFIALALALSGVPYRVGYKSKAWANGFLSHVTPVKTTAYASVMHLELARRFLTPLFGSTYVLGKTRAYPHANPPDSKTLEAMEALKLERLPSHKKHVLIHPGVSAMSQAKGIYKGWSASSWAEFILQLSRDHAVYLVGAKDDEAIIADILAILPESLGTFKNLFGQTKSFSDLAGLMTCMDVICAVDSAPMHLSIALKRPTLAFFGPTDPQLLVPPPTDAQGLIQTVFRTELACRPCLWQTRQSNCESSDCLKVSVKSMLKAVFDLIEQASPQETLH